MVMEADQTNRRREVTIKKSYDCPYCAEKECGRVWLSQLEEIIFCEGKGCALSSDRDQCPYSVGSAFTNCLNPEKDYEKD